MPRKYKRKDGRTSVYSKPSGKKKGRPSTCTDHLKEHAKTLASIGLKDAEIAKELDVAKTTFCQWRKDFPVFSDELEGCRNELLIEAKKCLLKRIKGYEYTETKAVKNKTELINKLTGRSLGIIQESTVVQKSVKEIPPDVAAAKYILDRRSPHFKRQPQILEEIPEGEDTIVINVIEVEGRKKGV